MSLVAGLDVGTTSIRAALFDGAGRRVSTAQRRLSISYPFDGAVEQDPDEIRDTAVELLAEAIEHAGVDASEVAAVGLANQRATVVAWDADSGRPLRPAIGWQDTRTADRVAEFRADGIPLNTSASCSKIEWLLANDEAVMAARKSGALRLGTIDSWLTCTLTSEGAFLTDPSNAGATGFYDATSGDWSEFVVEMFGADTSLLPAVAATNAIAGSTPVDMFGAVIPVAARAGDQQSACFANNLQSGSAKLTLGTSGMLDLSTGSELAIAPDGTYALPLWRLDRGSNSPSDQFCLEGSVNTAGAVIEWLVSVGLLYDVARIDEVVASSTDPVVFVPSLAGLGSPGLDPNARGLLASIGLDTTAADLVAGAVLGIAARVADIATVLDVGERIIIDGGLSRSSAVLAGVSDLSGREIVAAVDPETTLRGAAMLAATSVGFEMAPAEGASHGLPVAPSIGADQRQEILDRYAKFEAATATS